MTYAIIGSGTVGATLARLFTRAGVPARIATRRGPGSIVLEDAAREIVTPATMTDALDADVIITAVPFRAMPELGATRPDWSGRVLVDVTNAFGVDPGSFGGASSSQVNAGYFPGGVLVKALNHLPYGVFEKPVPAGGGRRAVFVSSDDRAASDTVADLAVALGFAPIDLGGLAVGGPLLSVGGPLLMKNLIEYAG